MLCPCAPVLWAVMDVHITTIHRALDCAHDHCQSLAPLLFVSALEVSIFYTDEKTEVQKGRATSSRSCDFDERPGLKPSSENLVQCCPAVTSGMMTMATVCSSRMATNIQRLGFFLVLSPTSSFLK